MSRNSTFNNAHKCYFHGDDHSNGSFTAFQLSSSQLSDYRFRMVGKPTPTQLFEDNPPLTRCQRRCSPVRSLSEILLQLLASSVTSANPCWNTSSSTTRNRVLSPSSSTTLLRAAFPHIWRRSIVYSGPPDRAFNALAALVEALLCSLKLLGLHS